MPTHDAEPTPGPSHRSTPPPPPRPEGEAGQAASHAGPSSGFARRLGDRVDAAVRRVFEGVEALRSFREVGVIYELAEAVTAARQPEVIEAALVRLAARLAGACRAELWLDRDERSKVEPRLLSLWTEAPGPMTEEAIEALGYPLAMGLWCGDHYQMTLQLYCATPKAKKRWTRGLVRRLGALCSIAAAGERGLHVSQRARVEAPAVAKAAVCDATFLNAVLPYALAQAHRHREPVMVVCVEVDRLASINRSHGPEAAASAVMRVAESIARTLRSSDIVARLDDDRIIILLPNAGASVATLMAEKVRGAIVRVSQPTAVSPQLTASIGVACYPDDATEMLTLLHAADDAMVVAKTRGGDQIALASPPPSLTLLRGSSDEIPRVSRERAG